jgi:hypothetical protein
MLALMPARTLARDAGFLSRFSTIGTVASTVPGNGDVNPYGVAVVPRSIGSLVQGNVLVSNFNNSGNNQGTGTTIVQIAPGGAVSLFAQINPATLPGPCPGGVGLTTALAVLRSGWVIVGSLPTADGMSATAMAGCLIVLNSSGQVVETISGSPINGPWDMTSLDLGGIAVLFVTNVLNGTVASSPNVVNQGTVVRIVLSTLRPASPPAVIDERVIASDFPERTDQAALVIGPTGLGLAGSVFEREADVATMGQARQFDSPLYVADSLANRIAVIPNALFRTSSAGAGMTVSSGGALNDPLGLAVAPNGDIVTANGDDGNLVETTPGGAQVATRLVDDTGSPPGSGTLFGLAVAPGGAGLYFVDDGSNTLNLLH